MFIWTEFCSIEIPAVQLALQLLDIVHSDLPAGLRGQSDRASVICEPPQGPFSFASLSFTPLLLLCLLANH